MPAVPSAPAVARALVAAASPPGAYDAHSLALLTSELVSNAVVHAGMAATQDIVVKVADGKCLRVEVLDKGSAFDPPDQRIRSEPIGGWGLRLVDRLAARWGTDREDRGNKVWFELDR